MLDPNLYYRGIVDADMKLSRKEGKKAQERMVKSKAYSHGILVYTLYMPKIFTPTAERYFCYAADMMYGILDKVIREYERNAEYRKLFGFDERLEELILRPRMYDCSLPIARIDIFFNEDDYSFKFCEFNADGASAMNEDKELYGVISETEAFKRFEKRFDVRSNELFDSWAECFFDIYASSENAVEKPHVAIVDFLHGEKHNYEFEEFRSAFENQNCTCEICEITSLKYKDGALYSHSGKKIDAVYRRAVTCDIMESYDEVGDFINAVKDNAVVLIGDFRTQVIHNKIIFKILRDPMTANILDEAERAFVEEHIPFTVSLTEENVKKYNVFEEKEKWVIKPEDSYASRGVIAGVEDVSDKKWRKAVREGIGNHYILQEYCKPYESPNIDLLHKSDAEYKNYSNITGLFVYGGKLAGLYSRIARTSIISTQYSEMSLPTIVAEEKVRPDERCREK